MAQNQIRSTYTQQFLYIIRIKPAAFWNTSFHLIKFGVIVPDKNQLILLEVHERQEALFFETGISQIRKFYFEFR